MQVEFEGQCYVTFRIVDDFGLHAFDLIGVPRRCARSDDRDPLYVPNVDSRRVTPLTTPAEQLVSFPPKEPWISLTGRAQIRLFAAFLLGEDPQRRLDAQRTAALMHQMSLVQHVVTTETLRRVIVADEVGLGKTIEAGMIIRRVLEEMPRARVLYLAPARLVRNVVSEFRQKLDLDARSWVAGTPGDARLDSDRIIVASIHRAVFADNRERVLASGPWDIIVIDECHHLSDWGEGGGKPNQSYKLAQGLANSLASGGRLILLSGTPHQGSITRFENLVRLLADDPKRLEPAYGRVIYRTKDRVRDWRGRPLFPRRDVRPARLVGLGPEFHCWYEAIAALYDRPGARGSTARAAGWAKGQALQWASSSIEAGLGYLARLAIRRLNWTLTEPALARALAELRPYRGGVADEQLDQLFNRLRRDVQTPYVEVLEDQEDVDAEEQWRPDPQALGDVLERGVQLLRNPAAYAKWRALDALLSEAGTDKVVLFAQPVETVTVVSRHLQQRFGSKPAMIVGNQSDEEREAEVGRFRRADGPRFLVSSRAGGEGLNLQVAHRLVHLDVPWNPMELEQRVGRIHRFGSTKTAIVDTLIVQGTREVDMYRIAREKLRLIATQMDVEQFEVLFSRVMSLVPPKELEALLGGAAAERVNDDEAETIGRLVRQGFSAWEDFDRRFRKQAEEIQALSPGEATWADVRGFLVRAGNAKPAPDIDITVFESENDDVVAKPESAPAIKLDDELYVCADTGGAIAETDTGDAVPVLGLNNSKCQDLLRTSFAVETAGAGYLNRPSDLPNTFPETFGVLAFLRLAIRFSAGQTSERTATFHVFLITEAGDTHELASGDRATLTRALFSASRVREPQPNAITTPIGATERILIRQLRTVTDQERDEGVRPAVWPVAAFVVQ